jgi:glutamine synthetase
MSPADADMFAIPDPDSLIQLPWNKEVGWLASDLWMNGKPVEASPRVMLKNQIKRLSKHNMIIKSGVECEYFLTNPEGTSIADNKDVQSKPCYDQSALMRQYDLIKEICDSMLELGWNPYQNDHEDANGQFEMNWDYTDSLITADRHVFFKFMVKTIAEKRGLRATFMPKPFADLTGNGCHAHISAWSGSKNIFLDKGDKLGLTKVAYNFLGGILNSAEPLSAFFNPTINSYRRIDAPTTSSGATWSPSKISYTGNNRTHMIRIPDAGRFELRLMDGSSNPYLLQAGIIAAGIDGMEKRRDPGQPLFINMYTDGDNYPNIKKLPSSLEDALKNLSTSEVLLNAFGEKVIKSYLKLKEKELDNFNSKEKFSKKNPITEWERLNTLDC